VAGVFFDWNTGKTIALGGMTEGYDGQKSVEKRKNCPSCPSSMTLFGAGALSIGCPYPSVD